MRNKPVPFFSFLGWRGPNLITGEKGKGKKKRKERTKEKERRGGGASPE